MKILDFTIYDLQFQGILISGLLHLRFRKKVATYHKNAQEFLKFLLSIARKFGRA
jgi:hypothetical protein